MYNITNFVVQFAECLLLKEPLPKKIGPIDVERQKMAEKLIEVIEYSFYKVMRAYTVQSCILFFCYNYFSSDSHFLLFRAPYYILSCLRMGRWRCLGKCICM